MAVFSAFLVMEAISQIQGVSIGIIAIEVIDIFVCEIHGRDQEMHNEL